MRRGQPTVDGAGNVLDLPAVWRMPSRPHDLIGVIFSGVGRPRRGSVEHVSANSSPQARSTSCVVRFEGRINSRISARKKKKKARITHPTG
jgi:hypothetical protein